MKAENYSWNPQGTKKAAASPWGEAPAIPSPAPTTNEMADSLFGNNSSTRGQSSQQQPDAEQTVEQMQARTDRHAQAIAESQQRMLKMAAATAETGAATLNQLHHQGEQLKHIHKEQAKIDENLSTADKMLSSLESWRGAARTTVSGWFSGSRPASARGDKPSAAGDTSAPPPHALSASSKSPIGGLFGGAKASKQAAQAVDVSDDDAMMGQLSGLMDSLQAQALAMNAEIKGQSTLLDGTIESAERQEGKLDRNNARAKKLIGK